MNRCYTSLAQVAREFSQICIWALWRCCLYTRCIWDHLQWISWESRSTIIRLLFRGNIISLCIHFSLHPWFQHFLSPVSDSSMLMLFCQRFCTPGQELLTASYKVIKNALSMYMTVHATVSLSSPPKIYERDWSALREQFVYTCLRGSIGIMYRIFTYFYYLQSHHLLPVGRINKWLV